MSVFTR
jgi:CHAT domain-containing protein